MMVDVEWNVKDLLTPSIGKNGLYMILNGMITYGLCEMNKKGI